MDIVQLACANRLLCDLDLLKDDALEAAATAAPAPDCAISDHSDVLRWIATEGTIDAITMLIRGSTPRGLVLTTTVTVATGAADVRIADYAPVALPQGGALLQYVSHHPIAITTSLGTQWNRSHATVPLPSRGRAPSLDANAVSGSRARTFKNGLVSFS